MSKSFCSCPAGSSPSIAVPRRRRRRRGRRRRCVFPVGPPSGYCDRPFHCFELSPVSGSLILNFLRLSRPWTRGPLSPAGRGGQPPPRPWGGCCPGAPRPGPRRGGLVTRTPTGTETECRTSSRGSPGDRVLLPTVLVRIGLLRDNWNSSSAALLSVAKCVVVR